MSCHLIVTGSRSIVYYILGYRLDIEEIKYLTREPEKKLDTLKRHTHKAILNINTKKNTINKNETTK